MIQITYYGHSSFLIKGGEQSFVVDPFISPNPKAAHVDVDGIQVNQIFLSHAHQDHIADVERIAANNSKATVITNYELANFFTAKSLQSVGMNHGGIWTNDHLVAKYVTAIHSSSLPDGRYGGNPGGWVFQLEGKTIYFAGDTCLTQDMKLIPLTMGKVDLAILPIGGLFTMHAREAALAAQFVETQRVIGCHYDTFPPIEIDPKEASTHFSQNDIELHLLEIGATLEL